MFLPPRSACARRRTFIPTTIGVALVGLIALPGGAHAALVKSASGRPSELSARLQVLTTPAVRAQSNARQAQSVGLSDSGPGALVRDGRRVVVTARFDRDPSGSSAALEAAGATVLHVSSRYRTVSLSVSPGTLTTVTRVPGVTYLQELLRPILFRSGGQASLPPLRLDGAGSILTPRTCQGARTSAGDLQTTAATARRNYSVDGTGVTVGVLSDSFATSPDPEAPSLAQDIASADIPGPGNPCGAETPVRVLEEFGDDPGELGPDEPVASDEGRGMAQIVHDLAPGADLSFTSAFLGLEAFADGIRALKTDGANVIVDDVGYFEEPFFQDGPIGQAVNEVTSGPNPVSYFTSAGNANIEDSAGRNIASWESPAFRPTACPSVVMTDPDLYSDAIDAGAQITCEDFAPTGAVDPDFEITVAPGRTFSATLQWAQPWFGVTTDLDALILNQAGNQILGGSAGDNVSPGGQGTPFEFASYKNTSAGPVVVKLVIARYHLPDGISPGVDFGDTGTPRLKFVMMGGGETASEYPLSSGGDIVGPTIYGQSGTKSAVTVGAIDVNATDTAESYSSHGPRTIYFGPVIDDTPASPVAPEAIPKPDITASDCGDSTWNGGTFCGTSAAAPHAAAIAALLKQAKPSATPSQIITAMTATAKPIGSEPPTTVGVGLIDANAALGQLATSNPNDDTTTPVLTATGSITAADPTQVSRLKRSIAPSGCGLPTDTAALAGSTAYRYDAYALTNLTDEDQCVRVELAADGTCRTASRAYAATYLGDFVPADVSHNAVGATGASPSTAVGVGSFARIPAGSPFTVVVNETDANAGCGSYRLRVDALRPFAVARPDIDGSTTIGATLTADPGDWNGPASFGYTWLRCDSAGSSCNPIAGASGATYAPTAGDGGSTVRVTVTATQSGASSSSTTAPTAAITPATLTGGPPGTDAPGGPTPDTGVPGFPTTTVPLPTVIPNVPVEPGPKPKPQPKPRIRRTVMRLTGPRRAAHGKRVTYRVLVRTQSTTGKTSRLRGQTVRVLVDGKRRVTIKTDRKGSASFRVRFTRGLHRIQLVSQRRPNIPTPTMVTRTVRVR